MAEGSRPILDLLSHFKHLESDILCPPLRRNYEQMAEIGPTLPAMNRMKAHSFSSLASLLFVFAVGCSAQNRTEHDPKGETACEARGESGDTNSAILVFHDGDSIKSRVEQTTRKDGSLILRGDTTLSKTHSGKYVLIRELVEINAKGRLVYADVSALDENGIPFRRMLLDAERGAVFVQDTKGASWTKVEMDAPWLYAGLTGETNTFELPLTAVAAWTALSAARTGERVRIVDGASRSSATTTADQIVVNNENGEQIIVLGEGFATGDAGSITSLERADEAGLKTCNES